MLLLCLVYLHAVGVLSTPPLQVSDTIILAGNLFSVCYSWFESSLCHWLSSNCLLLIIHLLGWARCRRISCWKSQICKSAVSNSRVTTGTLWNTTFHLAQSLVAVFSCVQHNDTVASNPWPSLCELTKNVLMEELALPWHLHLCWWVYWGELHCRYNCYHFSNYACNWTEVNVKQALTLATTQWEFCSCDIGHMLVLLAMVIADHWC